LCGPANPPKTNCAKAVQAYDTLVSQTENRCYLVGEPDSPTLSQISNGIRVYYPHAFDTDGYRRALQIDVTCFRPDPLGVLITKVNRVVDGTKSYVFQMTAWSEYACEKNQPIKYDCSATLNGNTTDLSIFDSNSTGPTYSDSQFDYYL